MSEDIIKQNTQKHQGDNQSNHQQPSSPRSNPNPNPNPIAQNQKEAHQADLDNQQQQNKSDHSKIKSKSSSRNSNKSDIQQKSEHSLQHKSQHGQERKSKHSQHQSKSENLQLKPIEGERKNSQRSQKKSHSSKKSKDISKKSSRSQSFKQKKQDKQEEQKKSQQSSKKSKSKDKSQISQRSEKIEQKIPRRGQKKFSSKSSSRKPEQFNQESLQKNSSKPYIMSGQIKDQSNPQSDFDQQGSQHPYQQSKQEEELYEEEDPMADYLRKQSQILQWWEENGRERPWIDSDFPADLKQFWKYNKVPTWAEQLKKIQWKRPKQLNKEAKFMDKGSDCDAKQGSFAQAWFIGALTIIAAKGEYLERLIVEKDHFDKGFVSFQFFKNGRWTQVIVDTLLPYQKDVNTSTSVYSACANPQQFWIQLMQKAYCKLHGCYSKICQGNILQGLVDLTGGIAQSWELQSTMDQNFIWHTMMNYFHQKFYIGCICYAPNKPTKGADQGISGILQNHYYSVVDIRDFQKEGLKLIRIRNPYGSDGVWTGPFSDDSEDWDKHRVLRDQLKKNNTYTSKKSDAVWWMNFSDWCSNFSKIQICKVFPQSWQNYAIEGFWKGKTCGGPCPPRAEYRNQQSKFDQQKKQLFIDDKRSVGDQMKRSKLKQQQVMKKKLKRSYQLPQYMQLDTDDRWFNNPQYKIKVFKDTKVYITLMQQDYKLNGPAYINANFMVIANHNRKNRIWQRPPDHDIVIEANKEGALQPQREITTCVTLKRFEQKKYGIYMVIPNILELSAKLIETKRIFYLRIFASERIQLSQMPETIEVSEEGMWGDDSGGSRKLAEKIEKNEKGQKLQKPIFIIKDNPDWCKNPQYFLNLQKTTHLKIILRRVGQVKKFRNVKVGMTICRYQTKQAVKVQTIQQKGSKSIQGNRNFLQLDLQRLLVQTSQQLKPPIMEAIQRKLTVGNNQKFKQSTYSSEDYAALYFNWNPTQGPFIIIPSQDTKAKTANFKLTIFSNNPVELQILNQKKNQAIIGRWQQKLSDGGSHLNQKLWVNNPKYMLKFRDGVQDAALQITLTIAEKNWKRKNKNTVKGMIGIYLLKKGQGKISTDQIIQQTNFLPTYETKMCLPYRLGGQGSILCKQGYLIMPATYEPDIRGSFILSARSDREFELYLYK